VLCSIPPARAHFQGAASSIADQTHRLPIFPELTLVPGTARSKQITLEKLPLEERIRRRAYEIHVRRGSRPGSELDDWLQAEEEIRRATEQAIDEASEESFPASDPPAY